MGLDISFSPHKTLFLHHIAPFDKHFLGSFANFNYFLHQLSSDSTLASICLYLPYPPHSQLPATDFRREVLSWGKSKVSVAPHVLHSCTWSPQEGRHELLTLLRHLLFFRSDRTYASTPFLVDKLDQILYELCCFRMSFATSHAMAHLAALQKEREEGDGDYTCQGKVLKAHSFILRMR